MEQMNEPSARSYNFVKALEFTLPWETGRDTMGRIPADGGLHYKDGGLATKYGIYQRANPDIDVANLSLEAAIELYKDRYWLPYLLSMKPVYVNLDVAEVGLAVSVFDGGVNLGVPQMMKWFKATVKEADQAKAINDLRRKAYYRIVDEHPEKRFNLKGWLNRLNDLLKYVDVLRLSPSGFSQ